KYNFGILKMDNNASNNSSNNNLSPNNIVCSHEPSHNTYDSNSDSSIRTTQEIFIRMSGKKGRTQSKQAAQLSSSHNESHTRHASRSIERYNKSRNESRTRHTSRSIERIHKLGNDIRKIKNELKHLREDPKKDLSTKVLDDMYTNIIKRLFPNHLYPSQRELKETIKEYINENFTEFVRNIGEVEFTN
ncbi:25993_t:CDS:2, partial [Gigaspora rosea]